MNKKRVAAAAAIAAAVLGTSASAQAQKSAVLGAWTGTGEWGNRIETVIEAIADDGLVTGTTCAVLWGGMIAGDRLKPREGATYEGWQVTAKAGWNLMVFIPEGDGRLTRLENYPTKWGGENTSATPMKRTEKVLCAHLFANEPRPLPTLANETGESLVGYWKGFHRRNGQQTELMVEHITRRGEAVGRWCTVSTTNGFTFLRDFYPGGPIKSRYDAKRGRLTIDVQATKRRKDKARYTLLTDRTVSMTRTNEVGSANERERHALLTRGADPEGCLAMTYRNAPWNGIGDRDAMHPRLSHIGQRLPRGWITKGGNEIGGK